MVKAGEMVKRTSSRYISDADLPDHPYQHYHDPCNGRSDRKVGCAYRHQSRTLLCFCRRLEVERDSASCEQTLLAVIKSIEQALEMGSHLHAASEQADRAFTEAQERLDSLNLLGGVKDDMKHAKEDDENLARSKNRIVKHWGKIKNKLSGNEKNVEIFVWEGPNNFHCEIVSLVLTQELYKALLLLFILQRVKVDQNPYLYLPPCRLEQMNSELAPLDDQKSLEYHLDGHTNRKLYVVIDRKQPIHIFQEVGNRDVFGNIWKVKHRFFLKGGAGAIVGADVVLSTFKGKVIRFLRRKGLDWQDSSVSWERLLETVLEEDGDWRITENLPPPPAASSPSSAGIPQRAPASPSPSPHSTPCSPFPSVQHMPTLTTPQATSNSAPLSYPVPAISSSGSTGAAQPAATTLLPQATSPSQSPSPPTTPQATPASHGHSHATSRSAMSPPSSAATQQTAGIIPAPSLPSVGLPSRSQKPVVQAPSSQLQPPLQSLSLPTTPQATLVSHGHSHATGHSAISPPNSVATQPTAGIIPVPSPPPVGLPPRSQKPVVQAPPSQLQPPPPLQRRGWFRVLVVDPLMQLAGMSPHKT